jgi:hypothetical protein
MEIYLGYILSFIILLVLILIISFIMRYFKSNKHKWIIFISLFITMWIIWFFISKALHAVYTPFAM